jgi:hypothetical protein
MQLLSLFRGLSDVFCAAMLPRPSRATTQRHLEPCEPASLTSNSDISKLWSFIQVRADEYGGQDDIV